MKKSSKMSGVYQTEKYVVGLLNGLLCFVVTDIVHSPRLVHYISLVTCQGMDQPDNLYVLWNKKLNKNSDIITM